MKLHLAVCSLFLLLLVPPSLAAPLDDSAALSGLTTARAVFDVRTGEPKRLLFIVKLIDQTYASVQAQGVKPDFVVAFRGPALPLLRKDPQRTDEAERAMLSEVRERLAELAGGRARVEACNVAAQIFQVKPEELAPGVTMIGNSLVSLIGYQNRGYAIVPME
jgi:intracellular sulfur oxidation DsrE/DsrF family protein